MPVRDATLVFCASQAQEAAEGHPHPAGCAGPCFSFPDPRALVGWQLEAAMPTNPVCFAPV